jgi:hypothetical protein
VVRCRIGSDYDETETTGVMEAGLARTLVFPDWRAASLGWFPVSCSLELAGDANPADNVVHDSARVVTRDVAVTGILAPRDTVDSGSAVIPTVIVRGDDAYPTSFPVIMTITPSGYRDTTLVSLAAHQVDTVAFRRTFTPVRHARHIARCSTAMAHDVGPANNLRAETLFVRTGIDEPLPPRDPSPGSLSLAPPAPNPFVARVVIRYRLPTEGPVELRVFSASGALVRELDAGTRAAGFYGVVWSGCDGRGRSVPAGVYFCRLDAGGLGVSRLMRRQ